MRPVASSGRSSTPDRRGVSCTPRPRLFPPLRKGRQGGWGVPSPWRRFRPVTALPTPWSEAALSWSATERGWCISPCRWCWANIHWGRWSRAKCLTTTPNNCAGARGQASRSLTGTSLAGGSPGTSCQAGHFGSVCRPAGDPGPDVPPDALSHDNGSRKTRAGTHGGSQRGPRPAPQTGPVGTGRRAVPDCAGLHDGIGQSLTSLLLGLRVAAEVPTFEEVARGLGNSAASPPRSWMRSGGWPGACARAFWTIWALRQP